MMHVVRVLLINILEEVFGRVSSAFSMTASKFFKSIMLIGLDGEICFKLADCKLMSKMIGEWSEESSDV